MINTERTKLEYKILKSALFYETAFHQLLDFGIETSVFRLENSKIIYAAMLEYFYDTNTYPNEINVAEKNLRNKPVFDALLTISGFSEHTGNIDFLIKTLHEDNIDLDIDGLKKEQSKLKGLEYAMKLQDQVTEIIVKNFEAYKETTKEEIVENVVKEILEANEGKVENYYKTGISGIDNKTLGIYRKGLTIIAARPSMGKTGMMMQLKRNFISQGLGVGIISLEESKEALYLRDISAMTEINSMLLEGNMTDEEGYEIKLAPHQIGDIQKIKSQLKTENYVIDDSSFQTIEKIKATFNKWIVKYKIQIGMIDYLQLLQAPKAERYDLAIGEMTKSLFQFAKKMTFPIILFSQLNREVEKRTDKRPMLSDLRDSGNIEQDARQVMFLYRPNYYGIKPEKQIFSMDRPVDPKEHLEIIIAKNRGGQTGIAYARYQKEYHKFYNAKTN